eukprot:2266213-Lingulodinium_polyedra.AAC.1
MQHWDCGVLSLRATTAHPAGTVAARRDGVLQVCIGRVAPPGRPARSSARGRARHVLSPVA